MSENRNEGSWELSQKEEEIQFCRRQLDGLEEEITSHAKQIKQQQEGLEDCYPSNQSLTELLYQAQRKLREKAELEATVFHAARQSIKDSLKHIEDQREQTKDHHKQEETSWDMF